MDTKTGITAELSTARSRVLFKTRLDFEWTRRHPDCGLRVYTKKGTGNIVAISLCGLKYLVLIHRVGKELMFDVTGVSLKAKIVTRRKDGKKTPPDAITVALKGCDDYVLKLACVDNHINYEDYGLMNFGMRKMIIANRLRTLVRRGKPVLILNDYIRKLELT